MCILFRCSYLLYSISHPNKHGEPTFDLSSDSDATVDNYTDLTECQLKLHRVFKKMFSVYNLCYPVTEDLCRILKCKLWRMGQRLCGAGSNKRRKMLEEWNKPNSDWELYIDCVKINKSLGAQLSFNEAKLQKIIQKQEETQTELEATKKKLKEIQNCQAKLIKSNKRMSCALASESGESKRKRLDISSVSRQQRWSRKQQLHTNITQAVSFLEEEGVHPSCINLVYNETGETESLNLESGEYSKIHSESSTAINDSPEMILFVKDQFGLSDTAYHELSMVCQHLPRSCKLKKIAGNLNSEWEIKPCPGGSGIQQSLGSRLKERIKYLLQQKKVASGDILKVKLSGDGTKICRKLNLINFTFILLNEKAIATSP